MDEGGERNQDPTPLRLQQARLEGDIPKSHELAAALALLGAITAGYLTFFQISHWLSSTTNQWWSASLTPEEIVPKIQNVLWGLAGIITPFMAAIMFVGMASHWLQTGPIWNPKKAIPDSRNLGPSRWRQQMTVSHLAPTIGLGLPKIALGIAVMLLGTWYQRESLFALASAPANLIPGRLFEIVITVCVQVAATLAILGLADYGIQWFSHRRRMRMTHQEIREEQRRDGGDSVTRLRRRAGV